jgi:hypothetical protein
MDINIPTPSLSILATADLATAALAIAAVAAALTSAYNPILRVSSMPICSLYGEEPGVAHGTR